MNKGAKSKQLALQLANVFEVNQMEAIEQAMVYIRVGHLFLAAALPAEVYQEFRTMQEEEMTSDGESLQRARAKKEQGK